MKIEEMNIDQLKEEWVDVMNSFDDYDDKQLWRDKLKSLENRIKELET